MISGRPVLARVRRSGHRGHVDARVGSSGPEPLLAAALDLSRSHREHERFYASSPLETALRLQRHARTLQALADRWSTVEPSTRPAPSPYAGAEDLVGTLLAGAADMLDRVDLTPAALRADLAGARVALRGCTPSARCSPAQRTCAAGPPSSCTTTNAAGGRPATASNTSSGPWPSTRRPARPIALVGEGAARDT